MVRWGMVSLTSTTMLPSLRIPTRLSLKRRIFTVCPLPVTQCLDSRRFAAMAEVGFLDAGLAKQICRRPLRHDPSLLEDVGSGRDLQGLGHVLLDEKDRHAFPVDLGDHLEEMVHDCRGEAEGRLVQQEE